MKFIYIKHIKEWKQVVRSKGHGDSDGIWFECKTSSEWDNRLHCILDQYDFQFGRIHSDINVDKYSLIFRPIHFAVNFRYHRNETIDYTSPRGGISVVNSENNSPEITSTLLIYQASIRPTIKACFSDDNLKANKPGKPQGIHQIIKTLHI